MHNPSISLHSVTMYQHFNKLSLKKSSTQMSEVDYMDIMKDQVPSNQEAAIQDLDMSINLPDIDRASALTKSKVLESTEAILSTRLLYAKRKESISHGLRTGRFPSWFGSKLHCELNLPREDNDNFGTFLHGLQKETTSAFGNSILSYLERLISEKESESNKLRAEHLKSLQAETDGYTFATEKRKLDDAITAITAKHTTELQEHRQKLLSLYNQPTRPGHASYTSTNHKSHSKQQRNVGHYRYRGHSYVQRNKPY